MSERETTIQSMADEKTFIIYSSESKWIRKIKKFCHNKNYSIPYLSVTYHTNVIIYDVGSYTQFFCLYLENNED